MTVGGRDVLSVTSPPLLVGLGFEGPDFGTGAATMNFNGLYSVTAGGVLRLERASARQPNGSPSDDVAVPDVPDDIRMAFQTFVDMLVAGPTLTFDGTVLTLANGDQHAIADRDETPPGTATARLTAPPGWTIAPMFHGERASHTYGFSSDGIGRLSYAEWYGTDLEHVSYVQCIGSSAPNLVNPETVLYTCESPTGTSTVGKAIAGGDFDAVRKVEVTVAAGAEATAQAILDSLH